MLRAAQWVLFGLLGLLVADCGGGGAGDKISGTPPPRIPAASDAVDETLPRFLAAVKSRDCGRLARFMPHRSQRAPDVRDKAPDRAECATLKRRAREFPTGFRATNARAFGTAAIVDGSSRLGELTTL